MRCSVCGQETYLLCSECPSYRLSASRAFCSERCRADHARREHRKATCVHVWESREDRGDHGTGQLVTVCSKCGVWL